MQKCKLIVIRHGETEWNVKGIWQGQKNSPLTERGLKQADAVAECLSEERPSTIYSSDLGRSIQSATPSSVKLALEIQFDSRLRERSFGVLEGLSKEQSQENYPGVWEHLGKKDPHFKPEGGESLYEKQQRFEAVYQEIADKHAGEVVAVFTHGGGLDAILRRTLRLPLDQSRPYVLWNGAINRFQIEGGEWILETLGDIGHLKGFESAFRPR